MRTALYGKNLQFSLPNPPDLRLAGHILPMLALGVFIRVTDLLAPDVRLGLLVNNEVLDFRDGLQGLLLDARDERFAGRDIVDETDDLACCPGLEEGQVSNGQVVM